MVPPLAPPSAPLPSVIQSIPIGGRNIGFGTGSESEPTPSVKVLPLVPSVDTAHTSSGSLASEPLDSRTGVGVSNVFLKMRISTCMRPWVMAVGWLDWRRWMMMLKRQC